MLPELTGENEPVSTTNPAFARVVIEALGAGDVVPAMIRYSRSAGAKDYYALRSEADFRSLVGSLTPNTSLSVFFRAAFPIRGIANEETAKQVVELLQRLHDDPGEDSWGAVDIVILDGPESWLDHAHVACLTSPREVSDWLERHSSANIVAGQFAFWHDNGDDVVTAYLPDTDGTVGGGVYQPLGRLVGSCRNVTRILLNTNTKHGHSSRLHARERLPG
jgi:hypothetical protein